MKLRIPVCITLFLFLLVCGGCPPKEAVQTEKVDLSWQHVTFDSPDYFWREDFVSTYSSFEERKNASVEMTNTAKKTITDLREHGLLGPHPIVFDPLVTKGQSATLSGNMHDLNGESKQSINYVFCWMMPGRDGKKDRRFVSILPGDRIVIESPDPGKPPSVRFKFQLDQVGDLYDWAYENPGILINGDQVVYTTLSISDRQIKQGYLGLR